MHHGVSVVAFINHYAHGTTKFVTDCWNALPETVYMSWGCSTQLAQYSNFMDVCTMTQDSLRPVKERAGTELNPGAGFWGFQKPPQQ